MDFTAVTVDAVIGRFKFYRKSLNVLDPTMGYRFPNQTGMSPAYIQLGSRAVVVVWCEEAIR